MGLPYGEKIVDTHSTSLTQSTQIFTFAHSIVKHIASVASGDRKITDCIGFSVIFGRYSVFSGFSNTEVGIGVGF